MHLFLNVSVWKNYQIGPQNPTQRLQDGEGWATGWHQFLVTLLGCEKWWERWPGEAWEVVIGFSSFGGLGALLVWGGLALPWGVGAVGHWVCALGKYLDPAGDRISMAP